ncbi:hypothetical protein EKO04_011628 [Ascochyta lentis]|uniref:Uncharacterized protein n=1 Tax=Ascochyta lentis TaxID=205686 RepID=A0A8H7MCK7_9PLEO|nr:hypothetical protein EKO04_011628 [Ascochyta lentis]
MDKRNAVLPVVSSDFAEDPSITIERLASFVHVPVSTLVASCSCGCKAFGACGRAYGGRACPVWPRRGADVTELLPTPINQFAKDAAACDCFLATGTARNLSVKDFIIEGELVSDNEAS